jgi:hypothetical protein
VLPDPDEIILPDLQKKILPKGAEICSGSRQLVKFGKIISRKLLRKNA